ncbi:hypothetical protein [Streptomyces hundungensis]|uniref:hypothetical protein n=1 Tax=Streptomyces hundungensis TaxID=1077946 RepID=UPI0033D3F8FF
MRSPGRTAIEAAERQHTSVAGEKAVAVMVATLAREVIVLNKKISEVERQIEASFRAHSQASIVASMPGIGNLLGAEILAAMSSITCCSESCRYYDRERAEGKRHSKQSRRWPGDESTSCGHFSETRGSTNSGHQQQPPNRTSRRS